MANTINWGKIYEKTAWGIGVVTNTINWGKIYADLVSAIPSFALNFATISDDFTFTRSSFATRVNEFGLIETVTDLGNELVTNGTFDTDSDWSKLNATISGGKGNLDSTSSTSILFQSSILVIGKTYKATLDVSNYNGVGTCALIDSNGIPQQEFTSNGSKEFYFTHGGASTNLSFRAVSGGIFSIDNISVKEVLEDDVPRIDYSDATFDVPVLGNELIDYSNITYGSGGWSLVNGKWFFDDVTFGHILTDGINAVVGEQYEVTVDVTISSGNANLRLTSGNGQTQLFNYTDFPNGVTTFISTVTGVDGIVNRLNAPTTLTDNPFTLNSISVKKVTAYTTADKGSFLLEPQSTNLFPYSEDFSQWNAISNPTVTLNQAISPDGTNNATLLEFDQTVTTSRIEVPIPSGGAGDWVFSIWAKSVSGNDVSFGMEIGSAGTLEQERVATSEWKRFNVVGATTSSVNLYPQIEAWTTNNESIYIWGAQVEALPYATSYIPTNGSVVTRSQESCVDATPTINSEEGVLYFEGSALVETNTVTNRHIALSNGATLNNRLYFYLSKTGRFGFASFVGGVLQANITFDGVVTDNSKVACKWKENDYALWVNGVEVGTDNLASVWTANTLNTLNFSNPIGTDVFYGNTKDLKIYDKALSDSELEELTTI